MELTSALILWRPFRICEFDGAIPGEISEGPPAVNMPGDYPFFN